jgi:outer membrane protein TolC
LKIANFVRLLNKTPVLGFWASILMIALAGATEKSPTLSVSQALSTALERYPAVQSSHEKITEVDQRVSRAYSSLFPQIAIDGSIQYKKDAITDPISRFDGHPYNYYDVGIKATEPIWASGAVWAGIDRAKSDRDAAAIDEALSRRELGLKVIEAFYGVLLHQRNLKTYQKEQKVNEELISTANRYYKVGRSQLVDVYQIKTQVASLELKIQQASNEMQTSATQLATYLNETLSPDISIRGSLEPPDFKALDAEMRGKKPRLLEVEKADQKLRELDSQRTLDLAPDLPSLNATGSVGRLSFVNADLLKDEATEWAIGIELKIPIFSGLSSLYERRALASQEKQLTIEREGALDEAVMTEVQKRRDMETAADRVKSASTAFDLSQLSVNEAVKDYKLGTVNLLQLQTSKQAALDAEVALDNARFDSVLSFARYAAAIGIPPEEIVKHLESRP